MDVPALKTIDGIEQYEQFIGPETVDRILTKARSLGDLHAVHVNSTYYGGGVAEILSSLTLLMNTVGIPTGWRTIQGRPDFFSITKKMHNALQGRDINLSDLKIQIYEEVVEENAIRIHFDHDVVIVHDPQPLPLIRHFRKKCPWIWRCHVDLSAPDRGLWEFLRPMIDLYDVSIFSVPEYAQPLGCPTRFFLPAIDPFNSKNAEIDDDVVEDRFGHYNIPTDLPIIAQISRFDPWKDPRGVIDSFQKIRKEVDCTLVLLGNVATDDPEGQEVFESLLSAQEERIIILSAQDTCLVNALQRRAAVIIQKSLREGFGLTVTEAMFKGTPVVAGNVGGIRHQIADGENGFLVDSIDGCADRVIRLLKDSDLGRRIGTRGRQSVIEHFLMSRLLENYIDLFGAFRPHFFISE